MPARRPIGQAELEILKYIQDHAPVTVRQVADHLGRTKGVVRTTVLNVMSRLVSKGYLARKKSAGVFQYSPRVGKAHLLQTLVGEFVDKALGGSVSPFMAYLAEDARLSEQDVADLKRLLQTLDRNRPNKPEGRP
jgi:BlaI family penicillinase repressor